MDSLKLDSQACAILADCGPLGRHSRQELAARLSSMGKRGVVHVVDAADGERVCSLMARAA